MKIGVCGVACEKCPKMVLKTCPNGEAGCLPKENRFCAIASCAFQRGIRLCFECSEFPCETTRQGPIAYNYCRFIAGKES